MSTNWFELATDILYGGAKAMQTHEESLQSRSGCDDTPVPCANCGHLDIAHHPESLRCFACDCDCRRFNPVTIDDILDTEGILD